MEARRGMRRRIMRSLSGIRDWLMANLRVVWVVQCTARRILDYDGFYGQCSAPGGMV